MEIAPDFKTFQTIQRTILFSPPPSTALSPSGAGHTGHSPRPAGPPEPAWRLGLRRYTASRRWQPGPPRLGAAPTAGPRRLARRRRSVIRRPRRRRQRRRVGVGGDGGSASAATEGAGRWDRVAAVMAEKRFRASDSEGRGSCEVAGAGEFTRRRPWI